MINENEVVLLLLCIGVVIFVISNRRGYKRIPGWKLLLAAFWAFLGAAASTVAEDLILPVLLNILEHLLYVCSSLLMLIWCWNTFRTGKGGV